MVNEHRQPQRMFPMIALTRSIRRISDAHLTKCQHLFLSFAFFPSKMKARRFSMDCYRIYSNDLNQSHSTVASIFTYSNFNNKRYLAVSHCCFHRLQFVSFFVGSVCKEKRRKCNKMEKNQHCKIVLHRYLNPNVSRFSN